MRGRRCLRLAWARTGRRDDEMLDLLRFPAAVLQENGALFAANESFGRPISSIFEDRRARLVAKDEKADALVAGRWFPGRSEREQFSRFRCTLRRTGRR